MKSKFSIIFILLSALLFPQSDIKVISSDRNSLVVEYTPIIEDSSIVKIDNSDYLKLTFLNGTYLTKDLSGSPALPVRVIAVGVPQEFGNTIEILASEYVDYNLLPAPLPVQFKNGNIDSYKYEITENYRNFTEDNDIVKFGTYGISRTTNNQNIVICPVKYFPQERLTRFYKKIIFRINFTQNQQISNRPSDDFVKEAIINFETAKYWNNQTFSLKKENSSSVLATGKWIKFEAPQEGIYKISKSILQQMGFDVNTLDPRTIKIFNNGGRMLPEALNVTAVTDLTEVPVFISGEGDGKFDDGDYILFYGRGTKFWEFNNATNKFVRRYNNYSNENYFWITTGGNNGIRMQKTNTNYSTAVDSQTTTKAFAYWEEDLINLPKSGREFIGDEFGETNKSRTYMNLLPGILPNSQINYAVHFVNTDEDAIALKIEENGHQLFYENIAGIRNATSDWTYLTGNAHYRTFSYASTLSDSRSILKFTFNAQGVTSKGYLDFFEIQYNKELSAYNNELIFYSTSKDTNKITQFLLKGFTTSNITVIEVTNDVPKIVSDNVYLSGGECHFKTNGSYYPRKFVSAENSTFKTPVNFTEVSNSNLHGIQTGAKFIVITPKAFKEAADRLKQHKENNSKLNLSTIVVDIDEILNEFSCGMEDPSAVRNFVRYAFNNWQIRPEAVLLFGDGTYDFKNIEKLGKNFIPTYQIKWDTFTKDLHHILTYSSDDYFVKVNGNDPYTDLALGRLPVQSLTEANNVVDKIIKYETGSDRESWRNLITLIADDGYTSTDYEGGEHTRPSEVIAETFVPKSFDINKIYMAAYTPIHTAAGRRKPQVTKDLLAALNEGTLLINYIGHGSPEVWTHEYIFEKDIFIPQLKNDRYFTLVAGTCDFGYNDDPAKQSGAELLVLKKDAGAILAFTANRVVWSFLNHELMYRFYGYLFENLKDTMNLPFPFGKAVYLTKQYVSSENDEKYHLFGDPTIRLNMPQYQADFKTINGQPLVGEVQIKALSKTQITGVIKKSDNTVWTDLNGEGLLTVYDSQRQAYLEEIASYVKMQGGVVFKGRVSIVNGAFTADFMVPKDISYENKQGKILFYFYDNKIDGLGWNANIIIGGTDTTQANDNKGPDVNIYFDNVGYLGSNLVSPNSKLIVDLKDETGLNTTGSGIGHRLEGILNENEEEALDFSNYFTGELDAGGKAGKVEYPFVNLDPGDYKLLVKAYDVFNNFSSASIDFKVVNDDEFTVTDVYNYPNPFSGSTTFTLQQNLRVPVNVDIKVYTVAGRLIKTIERQGLNKGFITIDWDGRDQDGNSIANGTYLYKVILKTIDGKITKSVLGKLAVIR